MVGILWYFKSQHYYALKVCVSFTTTMFSRVDMIFFFLISGGRNINATQPQSTPPSNSTIQSFVRKYVNEYIG